MFLLKKSCYLLFILIGFLNGKILAEFPDDPKPCAYGDSDCLKKIINYFIAEGFNGDVNVGLVQIDPLKVPKMSIKQGADSPVNIDLEFTDNDIFGLKTVTISKVKGFGKELEERHDVYMKSKTVSLVGDYTINGRVLILPISGSGKSNITLTDTEMLMSFNGVPVEKNGEKYMGVKNMKIILKPGHITFYFGNLFNGDKDLGDNMNAFLNENWRDIFNECQTSLQTALAGVFEKVVGGVFGKYPYDKYFLE